MNKKDNVILEILTKRGIVPDDNAKGVDKQQERRKRAFHNTELLLKKYRDIIWMMECFPDSIAEELEEPLGDFDALFERLDLEMTLGNKKVERRMESMSKTRLLIDSFNDALTVLKKKPNEGEKLYEIIKITYIDSEVLNHTEILYRLNLSSRQYYRLREQATMIIALRLWSAPNNEIDFMIDVLSSLNNKH